MELKRNLCFDEHLFFRKNFSVDEFLTEHRRIANLETLRDDLGIYLKNLRSSTIELINKNYADFVDLSRNLTAMEESIANIEKPIDKIREEVLGTKTVLDKKIEKISNLLDQRKQIRKKMQSIESTMKVQTSLATLSSLLVDLSNDDSTENLNSLKLERALNEINQYYFHSKQCDTNVKQIFAKDFEHSFNIFLSHLKDLFLQSIKFEKKILVNCLRLYFAVNKTDVAHDLVRKEIIAPKLNKIISEDALRNEPDGLKGLYDKILYFVDNDLKYLLDVSRISTKDKYANAFNFMVFSIWPEIEERLEFNLKSIYSPGNPDNFFKHYTITLSFLNKLEELCITRTCVNDLRKSKAYQNFLHCWNLPVYYTLRFQEFGGKLEKTMHSHKHSLSESTEWKLVVSAEVCFCIFQCWDENIFIRQLAHRFWKFNLQILARYKTWIENAIDVKNLNQLTISKTDFLIYLYSDGCTLMGKFPEILNTAQQRVGHTLSSQILNSMEKCLQESQENLSQALKKVEQKIIELVFEKNVSIIRQVSDIPRLYRRTNREIPNQPCAYVSSLFTIIRNMIKLHPSHAANWIPPILSAITSAYYDQVSEVLTSVQRTEESLRKFKKFRDPMNLDNKNNTDDDKIRLQLRIDIEHYIKSIKDLTNSTENISKFSDLDNVLTSLKRN